MTAIPLSAAAEQRLQLVYPPPDRAEAHRMLVFECGSRIDAFGTEPDAFDRIRFAAMKVSQGHIEGLRYAIAVAQKDWRDLLVQAGFADDSTAHTRWLMPDSAEALAAFRRWDSPDPLHGSAVAALPGVVFAPRDWHVDSRDFTLHGVPAHVFTQGLLSAMVEHDQVMLPDPEADCRRYLQRIANGWQTRKVCHGWFGDPWHDASRDQAFAWLLPAAEAMVKYREITGTFTPAQKRGSLGSE